MDNPYAAPLVKNQQPARRGRFSFLVELTWAFCASLPLLWFGAIIVIVRFFFDGKIPPGMASILMFYTTLSACVILFLVSFVYNALAALKRRWIGILGAIINLLSVAFLVVLLLVATGHL
jgi:hypothetical protein